MGNTVKTFPLVLLFNEAEVSDKPVNKTVHRESSELDQIYRMGWTIGMNRGHAIVIEARKTMEKAEQKMEE